MKISMRTQQKQNWSNRLANCPWEDVAYWLYICRLWAWPLTWPSVAMQGQMSIATLTIDKYRNNLVGIIETKLIYLDQTCDTWLPLTRKLCLLHKRSRSQLTCWIEQKCFCLHCPWNTCVLHINQKGNKLCAYCVYPCTVYVTFSTQYSA